MCVCLPAVNTRLLFGLYGLALSASINFSHVCLSAFQVQQIDRVVEVVDEAVKGILTRTSLSE